jgi:hypothetical protein
MRYSRKACASLGCGLVGMALLMCASALPAQEVYKSVDAEGHVVYSDRAPTKSAPTTTVRVVEPDPAEVARLAKQQQLLAVTERQRAKDEATQEKTRALNEHNKQVACDNARNKYYRYKDSNRIYQRDADGNRVFYTDADADTLREQARRAMISACGTS